MGMFVANPLLDNVNVMHAFGADLFAADHNAEQIQLHSWGVWNLRWGTVRLLVLQWLFCFPFFIIVLLAEGAGEEEGSEEK